MTVPIVILDPIILKNDWIYLVFSFLAPLFAVQVQDVRDSKVTSPKLCVDKNKSRRSIIFKCTVFPDA